jgi:hypothetical protein
MSRVERIGGIQPLDADGCIVNPARRELIRQPWLAAVDDMVARCRAAFAGDIHSIYVRGSVARGIAVPGFSDLDMILALRDFAPLPLESEIRPLETAIQSSHDFVRGVELAVVERAVARAPLRSPAAIVLRTQSVCVFGRDLLPEIPPFRPGPESHIDAPRLRDSIGHVREKLRGRPSEDETRAYCVWLMKIVVRAAFELVADRESGYTRDLYFCAETVARHYPDCAARIWQAVEWAVDPPTDPAPLLEYLTDVEPLRVECCFGACDSQSLPARLARPAHDVLAKTLRLAGSDRAIRSKEDAVRK